MQTHLRLAEDRFKKIVDTFSQLILEIRKKITTAEDNATGFRSS